MVPIKIIRKEDVTDFHTPFLPPHYCYQGPAKKALEIARYYGFRLIPAPRAGHDDTIEHNGERLPEERIALLRTFLEQKMDIGGEPAYVAYIEKTAHRPERQLHLAIVGSPESSAEGVLLHTAMTILREQGVPNMSIHINSMGERDAYTAYVRELSIYCRKHLDEEGHCREHLKEGIVGMLQCDERHCQTIREHTPQTLSFLSEQCRHHFYEVLEYLETHETPYRINHHLLSPHPAATHTVFEVRSGETSFDDPWKCALHARGSRYDILSRRAGFGRTIPLVSVSISVRPSATVEKIYLSVAKKSSAHPARVFIAQMGLPAKRIAMQILEMLRRAHIPALTTLHRKTIAEQLESVRRHHIPLIVIIGQKEVLESTALVRHMETHEQLSIPLSRLPAYLKTVRV